MIMYLYTQGTTMDSGSTSDKPDVVSVANVQESGTETKSDASSDKHQPQGALKLRGP